MPFFKPDSESRDRRLARIDAWVWTLIYGGLLGLVLGLFVRRGDAAGMAGTVLVWGGAIVAVMGALLLVLRARISPPPGRNGPR